MLKLAVFISGSGTNLQAMIDRALQGRLKAEIKLVISDREDAYGLERARNHNIPSFVVDYKKYLASESNEELLEKAKNVLGKTPLSLRKLSSYLKAEEELLKILEPYEIDYVCLAGFMRLLTPYFLSHFKGSSGVFRVLNIHPALLPSFPGRHGYEDTFEYGCKWGGVTVHFVDEGEDTGPIIAQMVYPIFPSDSLESVRKRGLSLEYEIYSQCINWLAEGWVQIVPPIGEGKPRVIIKDPEYRNILKRWMEIAFRGDET